MRLPPAKLKIGFGTNDKVGQGLLKTVKTLEIDIAAIHNDIGARLRNNTIQRLDVRNFAVSDVDEDGNRTLDVDHRVQFHSALGATEAGPRKQRQTQVDGRRVQCIHRRVQIQAQVCIGIKWSSDLNEALSEIGVDPPIAALVGIGQSGAF